MLKLLYVFFPHPLFFPPYSLLFFPLFPPFFPFFPLNRLIFPLIFYFYFYLFIYLFIYLFFILLPSFLHTFFPLLFSLTFFPLPSFFRPSQPEGSSQLELVKASGLRSPEDFLSDLKLAEEEQQAEDQAKERHIEDECDNAALR